MGDWMGARDVSYSLTQPLAGLETFGCYVFDRKKFKFKRRCFMVRCGCVRIRFSVAKKGL